MLLAKVPPSDACSPPAPKGRNDSALEKKNRADTLSLPPRNSRSHVAVNWSSVYRPGLLTMYWPVFTEPLTGSKPGVQSCEQFAAATPEGIRKPSGLGNWLFLSCNSPAPLALA